MPSPRASCFASGSSRLDPSAGAPEHLVAASVDVRSACEDEEKVGEPIEVDRSERIRVGDREHCSLGSAADGAHEEEARGTLAPAGENEALQLRQPRVGLVDLLLE